jgi:hypothetical protein
VTHRGLEARKGKVAARAALHRPREVERRRVARLGGPFDRRAAGKAEADQLRDLVEGFARRIVDGAAELSIAADILGDQELAVPARDEKQQERKGDIVGEPGRQRMAFEVVDRDQRLARDRRHGLGRRQPDHDAADQAGARRRGDGIEVREVEPRLAQRLFDQEVDGLDMRARSDFGNDAAIGAMTVELGQHDMRADAPRVVDDRRCRLVAACLEAEHDHAPGHSSLPASGATTNIRALA